MKKSLLKLLSMILAALMMLGCFAACTGEEDGGQTPADATTADQTADETTAAPEDTGPIVYEAEIPEGTNYGGYDFRVAVADLSTIVWCDTDFSILEPSADIVENAVYERKIRVEGLLGVEIAPVLLCGRCGKRNEQEHSGRRERL